MRSNGIFPIVCSALIGLAAPGLAVAADGGAKVFEEVCTQCHTPTRNPLDDKHLSRDEWKETLERMKGYGAEIPKEKMPELLDYLARVKGPAGAAAESGKK